MGDNESWFNIKIKTDLKDKMKKAVKKSGITMKWAVVAFMESYISDPSQYKMKMEIPTK